jgi:hypothetical protein
MSIISLLQNACVAEAEPLEALGGGQPCPTPPPQAPSFPPKTKN